MRVLLDACVPKGLRTSLSGHDVRTAPEMGWGDLDNGELLDAMGGTFDALVTVDTRLPQQQRIVGRPLRVVILRAKSNRLSDLLPLVPNLLVALSTLEPGAVKDGDSRSDCNACRRAPHRVEGIHQGRHTQNDRTAARGVGCLRGQRGSQALRADLILPQRSSRTRCTLRQRFGSARTSSALSPAAGERRRWPSLGERGVCGGIGRVQDG